MERSIEVYENVGGFKLYSQAMEKGSVRSRLLEGFGVEVEEVFRWKG